MQEFFKYVYDFYILQTEVSVPFYYYVLIHLLVILPVNFLVFFLVFKSIKKSQYEKERRLRIGGAIMLCVVVFRYFLFYIYWHTILQLEMSEIAMYLIILAIYVIKKKWIYPIAFVAGFLSCLAVMLYPYVIFKSLIPFHFLPTSSIIFHALNGYLALMLALARGYVPRLKDFPKILICGAVLFGIILTANAILGENYMALSDPSDLPVISDTKPPVPVLVIFSLCVSVMFLVLAACEIAYRRFASES